MKLRLLISVVLFSIASTSHANPLDDLKARLHVKSKPPGVAPASATPASTDQRSAAPDSGGSVGAIDVAGIKPGMSMNQVINILKVKDPKAQTRKFISEFDWISNNTATGKWESVTVHFTETDRASTIERVFGSTEGFLYSNIVKQMRTKYGPEKTNTSYIYWTFNDDGTVGEDCGSAKTTCSSSIRIQTELPQATPNVSSTLVLQQVRVTLTDSTVSNAAIAASKAKGDAEAAAQKQKATNQAAKNTASF